MVHRKHFSVDDFEREISTVSHSKEKHNENSAKIEQFIVISWFTLDQTESLWIRLDQTESTHCLVHIESVWFTLTQSDSH